MVDKERLDWLEEHQGCALISDDMGHWAVSGDGFQTLSNLPPDDVETTFFIEKKQWKKSLREAIDSAMTEVGD